MTQEAKTNRKFQIWTEGYAATGEHGDASLMGEAEGATFDEAVDAFIAKHKEQNPNDAHHWKGSGRNAAFWACRVFDNEADARKSFG